MVPTNTAVTENQELGAVDSNTLANIHQSRQKQLCKVGVDNIEVEASAEKMLKELSYVKRVELNGTDRQKHTAV